MLQMRSVHKFAQARIGNRYLDVKEKTVQSIFQQGPGKDTDRDQPNQFAEPPILAARGQVEEKSPKKWENPEGPKKDQPLFHAHNHILVNRLSLIFFDIGVLIMSPHSTEAIDNETLNCNCAGNPDRRSD